jgi:hypothetical protein
MSLPKPKLKFLHPKTSMSPAKLEAFRRLATDKLEASLNIGQTGALKTGRTARSSTDTTG